MSRPCKSWGCRVLLSWTPFVLGVLPASAQGTGQFLVHPNLERGLNARTAYEIGLLDKVNLFNGNLTLTLPIGQSYPVAEGFSWGLTLAYNSQVWDWESLAAFCDRDGDGPGQPEPGTWSFAEPSHDFNAGLGWTLTPGRLYRPHQEPYPDSVSYRLITPDGGMRVFGESLHPLDPADTAFYTTDGSYLRLQEIPPGSFGSTGNAGDPPDPPDLSWHTVEFPNGLVYTFDGAGWCRRIEDRSGNGVTITPSPSYAAGDWIFEDDLGRKVVVEVEAGAGDRFRIDRIRVPVFGDTRSSDPVVEYDFQYSVRTLHRQAVADSCLNSPTLDLDHLDRIVLPDGTAYEFEYPANTDPGDPGGTPDLGGMVEALNLPTGGRYEWTYDRIEFPNPTEPTPPASLVPPFLARAFGVVARRKYDRPGTAGTNARLLLAEWTYDHLLNIPYSDPHTRYKWEKITAVVDPDLQETYHFFSTREDWTYGLPFTDRVSDPWNPDRLLSWYKVDPTRTPSNVFEMPDDVLQAGYVRYTADSSGQGTSNQRLEQSRSYFYDRLGPTTRDPCDPPLTTPDEYHFVEEVRSDFDGLGHHREIRSDGGLVTVPAGGTGPVIRDLSGEDLKIIRREYDRTTKTFSFDARTGTYGPDHDFSMIPVSEPWVLGVMSKQQVREGGEANTVEYCYARATGLVSRQRAYASEASGSAATPSGSDLLTVYDRDSHGDVVAESFYGGDGAGLGTGILCSVSLPPTPGFRMVFDHENGVRSASRYVDPSSPGRTVLVTGDADIDWATGLASAARDAAGVETTYVFDESGRIARIEPTDDAVYQFLYHPGANPVWAEVKRRTQGTTLLHTKLFFDGLGRVVEEHVRLPDGAGGSQWSKRIVAYDGRGRTAVVSGLQPVATAPGGFELTESFYGALGRRCKERRPDGSVTKLWTQGIQISRQRSDVRTPAGTEGVLRDFFQDAQGRLQKVREVSGPGGEAFYTDYDYDAAGRLELAGIRLSSSGLASAELEEGPATLSPTTHQLRRFEYDGRGLLLRECHPEKSYSGNGTGGCVEYGSYDALGGTGTRRDGSDAFEVSFAYDRAGRLTQIRQGPPAGSGALLKEYFYGRENSGGNLIKGKLFQAKRHNHLPDPATGEATDFVVTETYRYEGPEGRASARRTVVSDQRLESGGAFSFDQSFAYDPLGQLTSQIYPACGHAACAGGDPPRQVSYGYNNGFLTGVFGVADQSFANAISYHGNGALYQVMHGNGVVDTVERDPDWLPRPERLTAVGPGGATLWDSGVYGFDGSGNIRSIGGDQFFYDRVGRLVEASLSQGGATMVESYTYDQFGNMTGLGSAGGVRTYVIEEHTNRVHDPSNPGAYAYDPAGNLTVSPFGAFAYDAFGMVTTAMGTGKYEHYLYTSDDERIAKIDVQSQPPRVDWTLRGLDMKVLRTYASDLATGEDRGAWSWRQDYVYRGSSLLASLQYDQSHTGGQVQHFHLDHLGTPRVRTSEIGTLLSEHKYFPYGEEFTDPALDNEVMRFTAHERDHDPAGWGNDLDYMHARYYSPKMGRFLTVDPVLGVASAPQSWNRYTYVLGSPINFFDPFGEERVCYEQASTDDEGAPVEVCIESEVIEVVAEDPGENEVTLSQGGVPPGGYGFVAQSRLQAVPGHLGNAIWEGVRNWRRLPDGLLEGEIPEFESYLDCVDAGYCQIGILPIGPGGPGGKTARELIKGRLKRSRSYHSELEHKTYEEIVDLAKGKGPLARAAKQMKKLIEQLPRLTEKSKIR